jgi:hypothetical protein
MMNAMIPRNHTFIDGDGLNRVLRGKCGLFIEIILQVRDGNR